LDVLASLTPNESVLPTEIEKFVLRSLDHVGWYPQLWFPAVRREAIDFPGEPTDDEIHTALFRMIEDGAIEIGRREGDAFVRISVPIFEVPERLRECGSEYDLKIGENTRQQLHAGLKRNVVPPRGHFQLLAQGESFDVDAFLKSTRLELDLVWHRGEAAYRSNGVSRLLGNGATIGLERQQQIAVEFLKANRDPLRS
jgi:hypothetical protein